MRTEPKASYRTVQYEYAYRYTPNINIILYGLKTDGWWVFEFIDVYWDKFIGVKWNLWVVLTTNLIWQLFFSPPQRNRCLYVLEVRGPKRTWMISSVTMLIVTTWRSSQMAPRRTQAWVWCHFKFFFFYYFFFLSYCNNSYVSITLLLCAFCQSQSQSQLYCQFCHMYRTYIQRIEIALLSYSLVHTDNTKHKQ